MSKKYEIFVFSPGVLFNRSDDEAEVAVAEREYLTTIIKSFVAEEDFADKKIPELIAHTQDEIAANMLERNEFRGGSWFDIGCDMIERLKKNHKLAASKWGDITLMASIATGKLYADNLDARKLLRPWLPKLLEVVDRKSNETYLWGGHEEDGSEFLAIAAVPDPVNKNSANRRLKLLENFKQLRRGFTQIQLVGLRNRDGIETAVKDGLYQHVSYSYGVAHEAEQFAKIKGMKQQITVICRPEETAWRDEAAAKGYRVALIKGDGSGVASDYQNIDYGKLIRATSGEVVEERPVADMDSPFAKLAKLVR